MAYVFNNIMGQLKDQEDQPNQTNIFAEGQGSPDPSQGGEGANLGQQPKTSTEGDLSGGGGNTAATSENMPTDIKKQDSRALKRNIGKVSTPDFTNRIKSDLTTADQKLQDEANTYTQGFESAAGEYKVDDGMLDKAVEGDIDSQAKVQSRLLAEKRDYDDFKPETKTDFADVTNLSSSQGLSSLLGKEARGKLSGREIEFDRAVLERSPEFINIRNALKGQQSQLSEKASGLKESKTTEGQAAIDKAIEDAKMASRTGLESRDAQLRDMNQAEADAINAERKKMQAQGVPKEVIDRIQGVKGQLAQEFDDSMRLDGMLMDSKIDPNKHLQWAGDVGMNDMVDDSEAMKFNNIMMLLGNGGQSVLAGKGAGDAYSLNEKALREAIVADAQGRRGAADKGFMSERDKIKAAIEGRIGSENEKRQKAYEDEKARIIQQIKDNNKGMNFDLLDLEQFFGGPGNALNFDSLINEQEAARLNQINKELGQQGPVYKAGSGSGYTQADMKAINDYINSMKFKPGAPDPANQGTVGLAKVDKGSTSNKVGDMNSKGGSNGDPTHTLQQIATNPTATTKSVAKKLTPKKRW